MIENQEKEATVEIREYNLLEEEAPVELPKKKVKKTRQSKGPSIFSKWTDRFIQMINETV